MSLGVGASDVASIVALVVSVASIIVAGISLYLGFRESDRRDREIGLLQDEATRRDEELSLLREQVQRDRDDRELEKRARLTVTTTHAGSSSLGIEFGFRVTNAGPHYATNLLLRLRGEGGRLAGEAWYRDPIHAGGDPVDVTVTTPPPDSYFGPYEVEPSWEDGRGRIVSSPVLTVVRP